MNAEEFKALLTQLHACQAAMEWAEGKSLAETWKQCERGDWMLWLSGRMAGKDGWATRQEVVLAACDCAELVLSIFEAKYPDDKRPRNTVEMARKWVVGKATLEEVRTAADAAAKKEAQLKCANIARKLRVPSDESYK